MVTTHCPRKPFAWHTGQDDESPETRPVEATRDASGLRTDFDGTYPVEGEIRAGYKTPPTPTPSPPD